MPHNELHLRMFLPVFPLCDCGSGFTFWPIFHFRISGCGTFLYFLWTSKQSKKLVLLVFSSLAVMNSKVLCSVFPKVPATCTSLAYSSLLVRIKARGAVPFFASFALWMMKLLIERQKIKERNDSSNSDFNYFIGFAEFFHFLSLCQVSFSFDFSLQSTFFSFYLVFSSLLP